MTLRAMPNTPIIDVDGTVILDKNYVFRTDRNMTDKEKEQAFNLILSDSSKGIPNSEHEYFDTSISTINAKDVQLRERFQGVDAAKISPRTDIRSVYLYATTTSGTGTTPYHFYTGVNTLDEIVRINDTKDGVLAKCIYDNNASYVRRFEKVDVSINNINSSIVDISGRLNDTSIRLNNASIRLNDTSIRLNNASVRLRVTIVDLNRTKDLLNVTCSSVNATTTRLNNHIEDFNVLKQYTETLNSSFLTFKSDTNTSINNINASISDITNNVTVLRQDLTITNTSVNNIHTHVKNIQNDLDNPNPTLIISPSTLNWKINIFGKDSTEADLPLYTPSVDYYGNISWSHPSGYPDVTTMNIQGPMGPQGPEGPAGASGSSGGEGAEGPQGPMGPQGPEGPAGTATGVSGSQGTQGPQGPQGDRGPQGPSTGVTGPQGAQGPQGKEGAQGPQGPAATGSSFSIGNIWGGSGTSIVIGTSNDKLQTSGATCTTAGVMTADSYYANSDERLKENIEDIKSSDEQDILRPVEFDWISSGKHSYGFIAQELEAQGYKELVSVGDDGMKKVNYEAALALAYGQSLRRIETLEETVKMLLEKLKD